ncbi:MAG: type II/IV secretion system protein [Myxococcales bacterium]|nr:type II/IV secretion system protein [Myxococcales bacterium]
MSEPIADFDFGPYQVDPESVRLLPQMFCLTHDVIILGRVETGDRDPVVVGLADPNDLDTLDAISRVMRGRRVTPIKVAGEKIQKALAYAYGFDKVVDPPPGVPSPPQELEREVILGAEAPAEGDAGKQKSIHSAQLDREDDTPIKRLVNEVLITALRRGATDIHIENFRYETVTRLKVDGLLQRVRSPINKANVEEVVNRIKIVSRLDISEKRAPQDGRLTLPVNQGGNLYEVPFRVSIIPGPWGEDIVLRILDKSMAPIDLELLGFTSGDLDNFKRLIANPQGLILNSGPTGSGKTTTLYASLKHIRNPQIKILSAEDPIEYDIEGVCQKQVGPKLDFADLARAFLRHDPDVLLIGEIRDAETADAAAKAAQTGHLVLSTVHTNDAVSAISRLAGLGLEYDIVSSILLGVLSQRLVRRVCRQCAAPLLPNDRLRALFGRAAAGLDLVQGRGCEHCHQTGYRGRIGLFELFIVDDELQQHIQMETPLPEIQRLAIAKGMTPLVLDGLRKVAHQLTTLEEIVRVVPYRQIAANLRDAPAKPAA